MLTGDTLFVGDIARPDLAVERAEGARDIFRSLHERLLALRPTTEVWPGHLGGSLCGGPGMDMKVCSTIGYERAPQRAAGRARRGRASSRERWPGSARSRRTSERSWRSTAGRCVTGGVDVPPLTPRQLEQRAGRRARWSSTCAPTCSSTTPTSRARCAITTLRAGFGTQAGVDRRSASQEVVLRRPRRRRRARAPPARRRPSASRNLAGFLAGGMTSWREERRAVAARRAHRRSRELHERADGVGCRCSTCARRPSGTRATSPARSTCPTTTSTRCPTGSTRRGRWR